VTTFNLLYQNTLLQNSTNKSSVVSMISSRQISNFY